MRDSDSKSLDFLYKKIINQKIKPVVIVGGLHGDEIAGNIVAKKFEDRKNIIVFSDINRSGKRRLGSQDLNRHFDQKHHEIQNSILTRIESLKPELVISLHEDDNARGIYAYCSPNISDIVKSVLSLHGIPIAKSAYGDKTDKGVIDHGRQPYRGTLERALEKRSIPYCTIETPMHLDLQQRVTILQNLVSDLLASIKY